MDRSSVATLSQLTVIKLVYVGAALAMLRGCHSGSTELTVPKAMFSVRTARYPKWVHAKTDRCRRNSWSKSETSTPTT